MKRLLALITTFVVLVQVKSRLSAAVSLLEQILPLSNFFEPSQDRKAMEAAYSVSQWFISFKLPVLRLLV